MTGLRLAVVSSWSLLLFSTCAPPVVSLPPKDEAAPPQDCGALSRCDGTCVDLQKDPTSCGACGRSCVIPNATAGCQSGECVVASCQDGFYDTDKKVSNGCEATSVCVADAECKTSCDSIGKTSCEGASSVCKAPAESCNARDDNCNGSCDEGALPGCRVGVHRSVGKGHLYTTDATAASSPPFSIEAANYFYLYKSPAAGLVGFYLCAKGNGMYFLTPSATCEVIGVAGTLLGFAAPDSRCGALPLHRLHSPGSGDHFYTTSEAERDNAISKYGYQSEGIAAYIFLGP
jgi:hypothetical protein